MSKKKTEVKRENPPEAEGVIVEMTDDEGNVYLYSEELVLPVDDDRFAILISLEDEEEQAEDYEPEVIISKIVVDENGEDLYIEPTDEEFERAQAAYDKLFDEEAVGE